MQEVDIALRLPEDGTLPLLNRLASTSMACRKSPCFRRSSPSSSGSISSAQPRWKRQVPRLSSISSFFIRSAHIRLGSGAAGNRSCSHVVLAHDRHRRPAPRDPVLIRHHPAAPVEGDIDQPVDAGPCPFRGQWIPRDLTSTLAKIDNAPSFEDSIDQLTPSSALCIESATDIEITRSPIGADWLRRALRRSALCRRGSPSARREPRRTEMASNPMASAWWLSFSAAR